MKTLISILGAAALAFTAGCDNTNKSDSNRAAQNVNEERAEMREDLNDKVEGAREGLNELAQEANNVQNAEARFQREKSTRLTALRVAHQIEAAIPMYLGMGLTNAVITDASRMTVTDRITELDHRLTETAQAIEELQAVNPTDWGNRNDAVQKMMDDMTNAAEKARAALEDADYVNKPSS